MRANYKLQRLFVEHELMSGGMIVPDRAQTNYLCNVMRMRDRATVLVFNGRDGEWRATFERAGRREVRLTLTAQERAQTPPSDLVYAFAPLKAGRLDYMVQKAVEMGAGVLQPVLTQHGQVSKINVDKMRANAIEAAEQCGILTLPACNAPIGLDALLDGWDHARALIFADEDHATNNPTEQLTPLKGRPLGTLIGPEGGFSDRERTLLRSQPFVTAIPLGPRILRADTAAVAALAIIQAVAGDW